MIPKDILKRIITLESFECRLRGGESICILNPDDCPCGIEDKIHTIPFKKGEVVAAPNSLLISVNLTFKDEIEEFVFQRIRSYLAEQKNQPVSILKKPISEDYSITFFIHYDNTKVAGNPDKIIAFFNNFERNLAQAVVQGKMAINKFLRNFGSVFYAD